MLSVGGCVCWFRVNWLLCLLLAVAWFRVVVLPSVLGVVWRVVGLLICVELLQWLLASFGCLDACLLLGCSVCCLAFLRV